MLQEDRIGLGMAYLGVLILTYAMMFWGLR